MEWLRQNSWSLLIGITTIIATFTLYGYRIAALETKVVADEKAAVKLNQTFNDTNLQTQVSLAKIQTDIEYIKFQIVKALK